MDVTTPDAAPTPPATCPALPGSTPAATGANWSTFFKTLPSFLKNPIFVNLLRELGGTSDMHARGRKRPRPAPTEELKRGCVLSCLRRLCTVSPRDPDVNNEVAGAQKGGADVSPPPP